MDGIRSLDKNAACLLGAAESHSTVLSRRSDRKQPRRERITTMVEGAGIFTKPCFLSSLAIRRGPHSGCSVRVESRPCHRSCVRWVRHRARHCYGDDRWARLILYFGSAVRCDSDAFAAVKPRDPGHGMMSPIGTKRTFCCHAN